RALAFAVFLDLGQRDHLPGEDAVGVVERVAVGLEDPLPVAGPAVDALGDGRQGVALLDRVAARADAAGAALGGRHGVGAAADVGKIRLGASERAAASAALPAGRFGVGATLDAGKIRFAVVAHARTLLAGGCAGGRWHAGR